jgi:hypothetical protein
VRITGRKTQQQASCATCFDTLKIPLISGRSFDRSDTLESQPVAIINTSLVNLYWHVTPEARPPSAAWPSRNEDPIGQQIRFGGVAVLLAAIGLYGVIAQTVTERRQEISVRMALGATPGHVLRMFLRHGIVVVAAGIGRGIAAAVASARTLKSLVFGVTATDPATLAAVAALLTAVTLAASYLPARAATRVDPLEGLRSE